MTPGDQEIYTIVISTLLTELNIIRRREIAARKLTKFQYHISRLLNIPVDDPIELFRSEYNLERAIELINKNFNP